MTAVFNVPAPGEHLDASTLALLAEVDLDEMSVRALSEELAAGTSEPINGDSTTDVNLSTDGDPTVYPWTTNGLLEAAKHLSRCDQCTMDQAVLLASFTSAWQESPAASGLGSDPNLMDLHITAALDSFDETLPPTDSPLAIAKQRKPAGFLGVTGKQRPGNQDSQGSTVSGWRASGFGRAIGIRRNQILIAFATLAVAVPLLLQLRPTEQLGGVAMKSADTTVSASEAGTGMEFSDTQAASADTTAAMAAETTAAAAAALEPAASVTPNTLSRVSAAELGQSVESANELPASRDNGTTVAETSSNLNSDAVPNRDASAETVAAALDSESFDNTAARTSPALSTSPPPPPATVPGATSPVKTPIKPAPLPAPVPQPVPLPDAAPLPDVSPTSPPIATSAKTAAKSKDAVATGSAGVNVVGAAPVTPRGPAVTKASPKPSSKAKKARTTKSTSAPSPAATAAPSPAVAAPAAAAAIAAPTSGQLSVPIVDSAVLNLGNIGHDADPAALIIRFRSTYDRVRPQASATTAPSPIAAAPAAAPVAPAPAAAVSADPVFGDAGPPSTLAPSTVDRCVSVLFGSSDRQIVAAASGTIGSRSVWIVRVGSASGTVDLIIEMTNCAELLRQPFP